MIVLLFLCALTSLVAAGWFIWIAPDFVTWPDEQIER